MKWKFDKLVENDKFLMVVSLLLAVIMWLSIAYGVDTNDATRTFNQIPVKFDVENSVAGRLGLSPLLFEDINVRVTLQGNRGAMNSLTADDIIVTANLSGVTQSGKYEIRFEAYDYRHRGFEVMSIDPPSYGVAFDRIISVKMPVQIELENVKIPEGYILGQEMVNPQNINVTGPAEELSKIAKAIVRIDIGSEVKKTSTFTEDIQFYDSEGNVITSVFIDSDVKQGVVTLPVLKKKEVPVTVGFINMPSGFNLNSLGYTIDPSVMEIAGPAEIIDSINEIPLGYINMKELMPDTAVYYGAILPDGVISVDNINDALVTFTGENYQKSSFKVSDIRLINVPKEYDVTINTKLITDVEIYGPKNRIAALKSQNIVAEIDIADIDIRVGQMVVPIELSIIGEDSCWSYGEYTAVITVKAKTAG